MGLSNWVSDLGVPWKIALGIIGGAATVSSAYGLYTLYCHHVEHSKATAATDSSKDDETVDGSSEKRVLVLGLDGAGKSTFLSALAQQQANAQSEREATRPTEGFNVISLSTDGVSLNIWEIGGAKKFQSYWPNFVNDTNVIVYVIDSCASERFEESKGALTQLLSDGRLDGVPLVLLASKQDLPGAKSTEEIASFFELETLLSDRQTGVAGFKILADGQVSGLQEAKQLILNIRTR